jgi:hypothetical protein
MSQTLRQQDLYTEVEAAEMLNITVSRLHFLLNRHVFPDGNRPEHLVFRPSDILLLEIWARSTKVPKVLKMPRR